MDERKSPKASTSKHIPMRTHPEAEGYAYLVAGSRQHSMKETNNSQSRLIFKGKLADLEAMR